MSLGLLRFCCIVGLWWTVLWYILPVDFRQLSVPSLILLHIAPPLFVELMWFLFKRVRILFAAKAAKVAVAAQAKEQQTAFDSAMAAHQAELQHRRAYVECRAVWMVVPRVPEWHGGVSAQCVLLEGCAKKTQAAGYEVMLLPLLRQMFEAALQNKVVAWLPVYVLPASHSEAGIQQVLVEKAWRQAVTACGIEQVPSRFDCRFLPGAGPVAERVIALFEGDPSLPALVLLGMDSPEGDASEKDAVQGYAVVAVLLNRPGLVAQSRKEIVFGGDADIYTPYWERDHGSASQVHWGNVPQPLQADFLAIEPFATVHRPCLVCCEQPKRESELGRCIYHAVENALTNAGLRDLPFEGGGEADTKPLELGWLTHNAGGMSSKDRASRVTAISVTLRDFGCELKSLAETSNITIEYGDVGVACGVLVLSEALIRAAQQQKPVLAVEFGGENDIGVTLAQPLAEDA
jgi:hypothetical protein